MGDEKLASYRWPGSQVIIDDTKPGKLLVIIFSHFSVIFFFTHSRHIHSCFRKLGLEFYLQHYIVVVVIIVVVFSFSFDAVKCSKIFAVCKFSILICQKNPLSIVQEFFLIKWIVNHLTKET